MRTSRPLLLILALALLCGCGGRREYVVETRETGYKGKARHNPFLAAEYLLEENGYKAKREHGRAKMPDRYTTLVFPNGSLPTAGARRYREWIEEGGHLIYLASGFGNRNWSSDVDIWEVIWEADADYPLLEEFGIEITSGDEAGLGKVRVSRNDLEVDTRTSNQIDASDSEYRADVKLHSAGGTRLLSMPVERGRLTVLASADPFRNRYIENNDHARLLLELVEIEDERPYEVIFIYGRGTTFFAMLRHHAWMALVGLVALILLWIWKNLPRFGPTIPHIESGDSQFTEHIEMTGRFLWRNRASGSLLAPLATYIQRNLRKRHPHLSDSPDDQIEYFLENTELSREEISDALLGAPVKDPNSMTRTVKNLKILSEAL